MLRIFNVLDWWGDYNLVLADLLVFLLLFYAHWLRLAEILRKHICLCDATITI